MSAVLASRAAGAALAIVGGYLCGSIPFGVLVGRAYGVDPRAAGSGNTGATNVARLLGWFPGALVALGDIGKGYAPTLVSLATFGHDSWVPYLTAAAAVAGHAYPVFARFAGGKSVATAFGAVLALFPEPSLVTLGLFAGMVAVGRVVSVASITAALFFGLAVAARDAGSPPALAFTAAAVALIVFRHRSNLRRLARGEEPRFSFGSLEGGRKS